MRPYITASAQAAGAGDRPERSERESRDEREARNGAATAPGPDPAAGFDPMAADLMQLPAPTTALNRLRRKVGRVVLSTAAQTAVLVVIILNAITMGLETSDSIMANWGGTLHLLNQVAMTIFIVELALKLFALGPRFFRDGWNIFDFVVVAIALAPATGQFAVLRALRVMRVMRLINRMPQLRRIATALVQAIPGIGAIAGLMGIVFYVAAVMATMMYGDNFPEWFGTVGASLYSLFQIMTLESWSAGIVRPVMEVHPNAWIFFVTYILVSAFVMLNLFVAVIVDAMSSLSSTDPGTIKSPAPVPDAEPMREDFFSTGSEVRELRAEVAALRGLLEQAIAVSAAAGGGAGAAGASGVPASNAELDDAPPAAALNTAAASDGEDAEA
ncbi:ion transporter [Buchananella felis]|uniref:ion transporter n=1 Tax=Buchananella felis TaxID=3231492 RepID=UPI003529CBD5